MIMSEKTLDKCKCGVDATRRSSCVAPLGSHIDGHFYWVMCSICGIKTNYFHDDPDGASDAWNNKDTRPPVAYGNYKDHPNSPEVGTGAIIGWT
jgi:hypothetical protein